MRIGFSQFTTSIVGVVFALMASGCFQRGTEIRFYLARQDPAPLYSKGVSGLLYCGENVQTWAQVIRARAFFAKEIAPALAQRRETLSQDEFLKYLKTREHEDLYALDVRIQLGNATREQNVLAALREAMDLFHSRGITSSYRSALETRAYSYTEFERNTLREMSNLPHRLVIRTEAQSR